MAFLQLRNTLRYFAESTDPLPTSGIALGSTVYITDSNILLHFNGTAWVEKKSQYIVDELESIKTKLDTLIGGLVES